MSMSNSKQKLEKQLEKSLVNHLRNSNQTTTPMSNRQHSRGQRNDNLGVGGIGLILQNNNSYNFNPTMRYAKPEGL